MEENKVSVIIPTYKRSDMLPRAIDSVLNQTYKNIEVIVVDDNDPNTEWRKRTQELMQRYRDDNRVVYIMHTQNSNGSVARNTGIKYSTGTIIAFLDDDDTFCSTKIEKQVNALFQQPAFHANYCGWNRDGKTVIPHDEGNLSYNILSGDHIIYTNAIIMWKKDAVECGGWDETFKRHQEAAFLLRYFKAGQTISCVAEPLVQFDISDRRNAAGNARINEEQTLYFLNSYIDVINRQKKSVRRKVYLHRYRGIFLAYIKFKDFKGAMSFYFRKCLKYHFLFLFSLLSYMKARGKQQHEGQVL